MVNIIQGGKKDFTVIIDDLGNNGNPLDLTGVVEVITCMKNTDGSELMLTKTGGAITVIGNPIIGNLRVSLTAAQTALLAVVDSHMIEFSIDLGAGPIKMQIDNAYSVIKTIC